MLAVLGRNSFFCSSVPNCAMTGPIIPALNASGVGTNARSISSCQMWSWSSVQSWPPHSTGQRGTASPAALSVRMLSTTVVLGELATLGHRRADLLGRPWS